MALDDPQDLEQFLKDCNTAEEIAWEFQVNVVGPAKRLVLELVDRRARDSVADGIWAWRQMLAGHIVQRDIANDFIHWVRRIKIQKYDHSSEPEIVSWSHDDVWLSDDGGLGVQDMIATNWELVP